MILTDAVNERSSYLNSKFFNLPKEKQNAIINAGYRVFSENSYRKSPVSEIAKEAGISKALLFYYFKNKREFYMYLYNHVFSLMREMVGEEINVAEIDFYEAFLKSLKYQRKLLEQHAYIFRFMMKAIHEEDEEVVSEQIGVNNSQTSNTINGFLERIDKNKFKEGVDIDQLFNIIGWCMEGFWKEKYCSSHLDIDEIDAGYEKIINFFRKSTYKEEYLP